MKETIVKTSIFVTCILLIGYIISFVKEMIIAADFGVSQDVDAYILAITIPVNLFAIIAVSIQPIVIPIYSKVLYEEGSVEAKLYIDSLISLIVVASVVLIFLIELFANQIVFVFAPGLDDNAKNLVVTLLRITTPTILFSMLDRVFIGILNVHKSFVLPSLSVYFLNLGIIITIVLFHSKWGIVSACIGQVIGSIIQVLYLIILVKKHYKYSIKFSVFDKYIIQTLKSVVPIVWSTSFSEINTMVNRAVASFLFAGAISALGYSVKVNQVLLLFFTSAISTIIYPMYAEAAVKKDTSLLNSRINLTLSAYSFLLLPLMTSIFILKKELMEVAFARGVFDQDAVQLTQSLLGCYTIGMVFIALRETVTKVFYSLEDTKTPALNSSVGLVINIILSLSLPLIFGVEGLALASSLSAAFISISLIIRLRIKYPIINLKSFFYNLRKIVVPLVTMFICTKIIHLILVNYSPVIIIICCFMTGILVFMAMAYVFRVDVFVVLLKRMSKRL